MSDTDVEQGIYKNVDRPFCRAIIFQAQILVYPIVGEHTCPLL